MIKVSYNKETKRFSVTKSFSKWYVDYEDEDGESTASFNTSKEAYDWIDSQEAKRSSGEKFYVIKYPYQK